MFHVWGSRSVAAARLLVAMVLAGLVGLPSAAGAADRIGPRFFGVDLSISPATAEAWPVIEPGVVRVALAWSSVERSDGEFDWSTVDYKVATAHDHGAQPLLVLEGTPRFHALGADEPSYASAPDLRSYRAFVRALVGRYRDRADYQVWNEANVPMFFEGSPAHMARMTRILGRAKRKLAPDATVISPSFLLRGEPNSSQRKFFRRYWSQRSGGRVGRFVDAAAVSAYPMPDERPEEALDLTQWARKSLARRGWTGPLWVAEINYGANGLEPTPAISARLQAAYVVRTYVLHASSGTERVYWWRWERHQTVNTELQDRSGDLTRAGKAYGVVKDWLVGTRARGCSVTGKGVYSCTFRARGGVVRKIYWKRAGKSKRLDVPRGAVSKTTTNGIKRSLVPGRTFSVSTSPTMIEVQRAR